MLLGLRVLPARKERRGLLDPPDLQVRLELQGRQARLVPRGLLVLRGQLALREQLDLPDLRVLLGLVLLVQPGPQALRVRLALLALRVAERVELQTSGFQPQLGFPAPLRGVV